MLESKYQAGLINRIGERFPGALVFKMDPHQQQGILDLLILWGKKWASLEVKASAKAKRQPNQDYFVEKLDDMSFAAFIHPENEDEVLSALQQALGPRRRTRVSQS
jgi:hypothetical protein